MHYKKCAFFIFLRTKALQIVDMTQKNDTCHAHMRRVINLNFIYLFIYSVNCICYLSFFSFFSFLLYLLHINNKKVNYRSRYFIPYIVNIIFWFFVRRCCWRNSTTRCRRRGCRLRNQHTTWQLSHYIDFFGSHKKLFASAFFLEPAENLCSVVSWLTYRLQKKASFSIPESLKKEKKNENLTFLREK